MDITSIFAGIGALRNAVELVKTGKELLPKPQQEAVTRSLEEAERQARLAEAELAKGLGYQLCRCTFPPQIMLAVDTPFGREDRCPACRSMTEFNKPLSAMPDRQRTWMSR